jgi:3-hydroxypropanoate dehydrogenase
MKSAVPPAALDQLFRTARTFNEWNDETINDEVVHELYDLMKWGPTSGNSCPGRFVWVRSPEAKARLASLATEGNRSRVLTAPLTVIIGNDLNFTDALPKLLPAARVEAMRKMFQRPGVAEVTAMRNGTLQGAYLIVAARALGLDCGPMSGFDNAGVDEAFFVGTNIRSNFICCLGHGKPGAVHPRSPRLTFEETGRFV